MWESGKPWRRFVGGFIGLGRKVMLRSGALTVLHVTPGSFLQRIKHLLKSAMQVDLWRG